MIKARRPNIKEVAKLADVSVATVSRALSTPHVVAPETLDRVNKVIRDLQYFPNFQARNLRTAKTAFIIALVPDIANPFFSEIIRGIEQIARSAGYSVLLGETQYDTQIEDSYAHFVSTRQADGLISLLPRVPPIRSSGRPPFVNVSEYVNDPAITRVFIDNVSAMAGATEYLTMLGHSRIAYVGGRAMSPISVDRERGFRLGMERSGLSPDPCYFCTGDFSVHSGISAAGKLFANATRPTAVVCANDETAIGVINAAMAHGLRVPEDLSVIGFDDIPLARFYNPSLTTVAQPTLEIGQAAAELLIEMLIEPDVPPRFRVMPTELVVRNSTGRPPES